MYLISEHCESKCYRGIAQLVEHRSPKPSVVSSNLTAPAKNSRPKGRFFLHFEAVDENSQQKWFDHKRKADANMPVSESE